MKTPSPTAFVITLVAVTLFGAAAVNGHICLISPIQRGGYNITEPGEAACFAPNAPCGAGNPWWSRPVGPPTLSLVGGSSYRVLLQQNLNHYTVGNPGFLQIAWSCGSNQTSDSDFAPLAVIPDQWQHWQSTQTNYSIQILVPNGVNCVGTLQAIYHPNKPEEPIFHQCSDILISPSNPVQVAKITSGWLMGLLGEGRQYVSISPSTGARIGALANSPAPSPLISTGGVDGSSPTSLFLARAGQNGAYSLYPYLFPEQVFGAPVPLPLPQLNATSTFAWITVLTLTNQVIGDIPSGSLLLLGMVGAPATDNYNYQLYSWNQRDGLVLQIDGPDLNVGQIGFVNYMWATFDSTTQTVSILSGDEDANSDPMNAAILQFIIPSKQATLAVLDVSTYTFQSFQSINGKLFALSPGLANQGPLTPHQWSAVQFDPATGAIINAAPVAFSSQWTQTPVTFFGRYEGGVQNGVTNTGHIIHTFYRTLDNTDRKSVV